MLTPAALTPAAERSRPDDLDNAHDTVRTAAALARAGWSESALRAQLRARRWRRIGHAVLLHNGPPTASERTHIALANCGPRAVLTAFTAAELLGLSGWERSAVHVLVPGGTHIHRVAGLSIRAHYTDRWDPTQQLRARRLHMIAPALVRAAATFTDPRPAAGLLAAAVQQRLVAAAQLAEALTDAPRTRHRAALLAAVGDIAQGAQALSEIDFVRLCRRFRLPPPRQQVIRVEFDGRRRFLDAEWTRGDGQTVAAEVDGAVHLSPRRWWDDQARQNELVLAGTVVLRFPSVVVRTRPQLVAAQLRRALQL